MLSDHVKAGMQQAPHRSLFNALGFTQEEMKKPLIGIISSYNEIVPGHMGQRIRAGIGTETVALRAVERNAKAEAAELAACLHEYCPELPLTVISGVYDIRTGAVSFSEE